MLLTGCSVSPPPPTHYFILHSPVLPETVVNTQPKYPVTISLGSVVVAPPYNSENLVVKLKDEEIQFFNYEKWGAPPEKLLQNFFFKSLIFRNLFNVTDRNSRKTKSYQLQLEFEEFAHNREQSPHFGSLKLLAGLTQNSTSVFDWYKVYQVAIPTQSDQPVDIVKAINKALELLVNQLSADLELFFENKGRS